MSQSKKKPSGPKKNDKPAKKPRGKKGAVWTVGRAAPKGGV